VDFSKKKKALRGFGHFSSHINIFRKAGSAKQQDAATQFQLHDPP
jgi:hypothetical protein